MRFKEGAESPVKIKTCEVGKSAGFSLLAGLKAVK